MTTRATTTLASPRLASFAAFAAALVLFAAFAPEVAAAVGVWSTSTAYGHCFLVAPIAAWLLWERRAILARLPPRPSFRAALLALPLIPAWLAAELLGIMEGRQLVLMAFIQLTLLAALGLRLYWALAPACLYLVFLVPFGAFITPALQSFTAAFITGGLHLLHIPFEANSFQITIPEGSFYVAEACAGLRFLIAAVAFGSLYAVTMFRSPGRRAAFIAVSCVIPILANGVRGLGIVLLGHALGSAEAGAADHLIYGWVFFSAVILLLALAGLPFREAPAPLPAADTAPGAPAWRLAAPAAVALLALLAPASAALIEAQPGAMQPAAIPALAIPAACRPGAAQTGGSLRIQAYACGAQPVSVAATSFPRRTNPARILESLRAAAATPLQGEIDQEIDHARGTPWAILTGRDAGAAAYAIRLDNIQRVGGLRDRLAMARAMFTAGPPPIGLIVTAPSREALAAFLAAR
jgi:exosortase A